MSLDERGFSESLQWALVVPVLIGLVLGLVQTGVWVHGRSVAANAASAAGDIRATGPDRATEASQVAVRIAQEGGLGDVSVEVDAVDGLVIVTVFGSPPVFFDFGFQPVMESAVLALEEG